MGKGKGGVKWDEVYKYSSREKDFQCTINNNNNERMKNFLGEKYWLVIVGRMD